MKYQLYKNVSKKIDDSMFKYLNDLLRINFFLQFESNIATVWICTIDVNSPKTPIRIYGCYATFYGMSNYKQFSP